MSRIYSRKWRKMNDGSESCPLSVRPGTRFHRAGVRYMRSDDRGLLTRLAECHATFAESLVGRWSTAQGSFDNVMGERWEFLACGTLLVVPYGPFGRVYEQEVYAWKHAGPFRIHLGLRHDEGSPETWVSRLVTYAFDTLETDLGPEVVLREEGHEGFGIGLRGPPLRAIDRA